MQLAFAHEGERRHVEYAVFRSRSYPPPVFGSPELAAFVENHRSAVAREYEQKVHRYRDVEPQVCAQHILIRIHGIGETAARRRGEALLDRIRAGDDFAQVAREASDDEGTARLGGALGFNPRGRLVAEFEHALFALPDGAVSQLVQTTYGLHIIRRIASRQGDIAFDDAAPELAQGLWSDFQSLAAAERALESLREGASFEEIRAAMPPDPPEWSAGVGSFDAYRNGGPLAYSAPLVQSAFALADGVNIPEAPISALTGIVVFRARVLSPVAPTEAILECITERLQKPECESRSPLTADGPCQPCIEEAREAQLERLRGEDTLSGDRAQQLIDQLRDHMDVPD